jgi:hypothetical protein
VGGATLNEGNPMKTYLNFRNSLLMLTKNLPKDKLFFVLLLRLFMDGLAGIQFIFKGKFKHCLAIVHAHFAFYKLAKMRKIPNINNSFKNKLQNQIINIKYVFNCHSRWCWNCSHRSKRSIRY